MSGAMRSPEKLNQTLVDNRGYPRYIGYIETQRAGRYPANEDTHTMTTTKTKQELIAIAMAAIADDQAMDDKPARAVLEILEDGCDESVFGDMEDADETARETHAAILAGTYEGDEDADEIREMDVEFYVLDKMKEAVIDILNGYNVEERGSTVEVTVPGKSYKEWNAMSVDDAEEAAKDSLESYIDDCMDAKQVKELWEQGVTKEEWKEQAMRADGYAHCIGTYDGNAEEFDNGGETWCWFRRN